MFDDVYNSAGAVRKVAHGNRFMVLIKDNVLNNAFAPVGMKVGILILGWEGTRAIPSATDRTIAFEFCSRHRRTWRTDIRDLCIP